MELILEASEVTDPEERIQFLPSLVGLTWCAIFEDAAFRMAGDMIKEYGSGFWRFVRISDQDGNFITGFMYPDLDQEVTFLSMNGSVEKMSARHAGLCITLTALSQLSFHIDGDRFGTQAAMEHVATQYHTLRNWLYEGEFADLAGKPKQQLDAMQPLIKVLD